MGFFSSAEGTFVDKTEDHKEVVDEERTKKNVDSFCVEEDQPSTSGRVWKLCHSCVEEGGREG